MKIQSLLGAIMDNCSQMESSPIKVSLTGGNAVSDNSPKEITLNINLNINFNTTIDCITFSR